MSDIALVEAEPTRVLVVRGGWAGHDPVGCTDLLIERMGGRWEVDLADDLAVYEDAKRLRTYGLIVQCWSMGTLTAEQERGLVDAVASGVHFGGFHGGVIGTFVANDAYLRMVGARFLWHPDGLRDFRVEIVRAEHPIVRGIEPYVVHTEQYWLLSDGLDNVLATTTFAPTPSTPWDRPVTMPVVWTRKWGAGRVFVNALGHHVPDLEVPQTMTLLERGLEWAAGTLR